MIHFRSKYFEESLGEHTQRIRSVGRRPPLRTFREMCEKLGVKENAMRLYMGRDDAPKPEYISKGLKQNSWYKPREFAQWWRKVCEEKNEAKKETAKATQPCGAQADSKPQAQRRRPQAQASTA